MKHPKHRIEHHVPMNDREGVEGGEGEGPADSRPQIRRQLEHLCKGLGVEYVDLVELHISHNQVLMVTYDRNENGRLYRDEFNKVVTKQQRIEVDTYTFLGDEGDI